MDKYGWVDIGSSFLPSEIIAAFLWAQLENLDNIQARRKEIWNYYNNNLKDWASKNNILLPTIPGYATNNAHMFFLICESLEQRTRLIQDLKVNAIGAVFHYLSLHKSPYYADKHDARTLPNTDKFSDCLLRLPMFFELDVKKVTSAILN